MAGNNKVFNQKFDSFVGRFNFSFINKHVSIENVSNCLYRTFLFWRLLF